MRADGEIADVRFGNSEERDGAMDSAEEEIVAGVKVSGFGVFGDAKCEEILLAEFDGGSEVDLERGPPAFVIILVAPAWFIDFDGLAVEPYFRAVLDAVEIDFDESAV